MWAVIFVVAVAAGLIVFQTMATGGTYNRPYMDRPGPRNRRHRKRS